MKIAFFEIQDWEVEQLKTVFKKHDLLFFKESLTKEHITQIKDIDILSVFIYSQVDANVIRSLSNLKFISTRSMGYDHIDIKLAKKLKIPVSIATHYGDNSVAEHAFGLLLSISRNIHKAYVRTLNEDYSIEGLKGFDLKQKTLGVLGTGRIGSNLIKMAKGFDMNIIANDNYPDKKLAKKLSFKYVTLDQIYKNADIISIHVPNCKENFHLINESALSKMKENVVIINTARGPILDTKAVLSYLEKGKIAGLGIDVVEGEELIKEEKELLHDEKKLDLKKMRQLWIDHQLLHNEKVVFTPHIAFYTKEAVQRILDITIENINAAIKKKPINTVN